MNVILTLGTLAVLATITVCIITGLHLEQPWLPLWALGLLRCNHLVQVCLCRPGLTAR